MAPSLFLPDDFEGGTNNEVVTTENSVFDGMDWEPAPKLDSNAIFTTEYAHSGTKSVGATLGTYSNVYLGMNSTLVTDDPEDFSFWMLSLPDVTQPNNYSYVYRMYLAALGAVRAAEYDYLGVGVFVQASPDSPSDTVRWTVEFEDSEWTDDGWSTQVVIDTPRGEWVRLNPTIDAAGNMSVAMFGDSGVYYGVGESPIDGLAQRYGTGQYFCFHDINILNWLPYGRTFVDDINILSAPAEPPLVAGPGEYILHPDSTVFPSSDIFPGNNRIAGGAPPNSGFVPSISVGVPTPDSVSITVRRNPQGPAPESFQYELVGGGEVVTGFASESIPKILSGLKSSKNYNIRARARIDGEYTLWSNSYSFTTPSRESLRLTWNTPAKRYFEAGLDRGVLYRNNGPAVPWDGLISVEESGGEGATAYYVDGRPFLFLPKPKEYKATLSAYMYPDEFGEVMGVGEVADGMYLDSQASQSFGLSYRTYVGNAAGGIDNGYKLHLVYNATVTPSSVTFETYSDTINPSTFSWEIQAVPVRVEGFRPTAHIVIDTRKMTQSKVDAIEDLIYGVGPGTASMPDPQTVFDILSYGDTITVTDNGDGTFNVEGSYDNVYPLGDGEFRIENVDGQDNGNGTFTIQTTLD